MTKARPRRQTKSRNARQVSKTPAAVWELVTQLLERLDSVQELSSKDKNALAHLRDRLTKDRKKESKSKVRVQEVAYAIAELLLDGDRPGAYRPLRVFWGVPEGEEFVLMIETLFKDVSILTPPDGLLPIFKQLGKEASQILKIPVRIKVRPGGFS